VRKEWRNYIQPTETHKEILEQLFKEDHINPTHTINEITNLLKHYGDVESKNMFYWFQEYLSFQKIETIFFFVEHYFKKQKKKKKKLCNTTPSIQKILGETIFDV
jgi:hypothetical protein